MYILDSLCDAEGVKNVFSLIKTALAAMRLIVPIGLIVMTSIDIFKKVINPNDKDGQNKIITRIIASIVVFFIPVMIDFVIKLVTIGGGETGSGPCLSAWKGASAKWS